MTYADMFEGLEACLSNFINKPKFRSINWKYMFWCDEISQQKTKLKDVYGLNEKLRYLKYRYCKK